jgi:TrpR-related protein YerC/YecD
MLINLLILVLIDSFDGLRYCSPMKSRPPTLNDKAAESALFEAIAALSSIEEVQRFFYDLCTPAERQAMADRWNVVNPLLLGLSYRTIHEQTGVSVTTIGRVARALAEGKGGYQLIHERLYPK